MRVKTTPATCPLCGPDAPREVVAKARDFEYGTTGDQEFSFAKCVGCGIVLLDPRPVDESIGALYPPHYEPYRFDQLPLIVRTARDFVQRRKARSILSHATSHALILDVGCGGGALLKLLRSNGPASCRLVGWDYPGPHMTRLREDGLEVFAQPIDREHVPDIRPELIILNQVLEHFPRPAEVLSMLTEMAVRSSTFIIETPSTDGLDARLFGRRYWGGYHVPRHLVLFNEHNLTQLVRRAGLRVLSVERLPSPAFWVQSLHHSMSERPYLRSVAGVSSLKNPLAVGLATALDLARLPFSPTTNLRMIAKGAS